MLYTCGCVGVYVCMFIWHVYTCGCIHTVCPCGTCFLWLLGRKPIFFFQLGCESYPVGSICSSDSTLQKNKAQSLSLSAKGCMINI